jgi:hypothetical protein
LVISYVLSLVMCALMVSVTSFFSSSSLIFL